MEGNLCQSQGQIAVTTDPHPSHLHSQGLGSWLQRGLEEGRIVHGSYSRKFLMGQIRKIGIGHSSSGRGDGASQGFANGSLPWHPFRWRVTALGHEWQWPLG